MLVWEEESESDRQSYGFGDVRAMEVVFGDVRAVLLVAARRGEALRRPRKRSLSSPMPDISSCMNARSPFAPRITYSDALDHAAHPGSPALGSPGSRY